MKTYPMKNKHLFLVLFIILLSYQTSYSDNKFYLSLDHAQFLGPDNQCYLEIYYSIPENGPQYQKDENNEFGCAIYFTLNIFQNDSLWANKQWKIEKKFPDTTVLYQSNKHLVDLIRYPIQGGQKYALHLFARDHYSGKVDSTSAQLVGKSLIENQFCLSDLEIAMNIQPFSPASDPKFRKRAYDVVPNPGLTFGTDLLVLFYYFEIYNMTQDAADSQYAVLWEVKDSTDTIIDGNARSLVWRKIAHESSREIGHINVSALDNGRYSLGCSILTPFGKLAQKTSAKKFFVQNPVPVTPTAMNLMVPIEPFTLLDDFTEQQVDQEFDQIFALTTKETRKIYANLNSVDAKKRFIINIWTVNASNAGVDLMPYRDRFLQMITTADEKFKSSFKPGWKTDQGIVYLKYGPPSDIERHSSTAETKPYEVWRYDQIEGGVIFIFIDRSGFHQYELIHSTKRGELSEPNWQRYISTDISRY